MTEQLAVVTGASRGIGLEVCRQLASKGLHVLLTARDLAKAAEASAALARKNIEPMELDVTSAESVKRFSGAVEKKYGRLDVLVNNAGILPERWRPDKTLSAFDVTEDLLQKAWETNTLGPYRLIQALAPLMKKGGHGRIVNVSSVMGQLSDMGGGYPAYRLSKAALNALTRIFAAELSGNDILVNSAHPGWVRTEMGGKEAELEVEAGADTIVWLATLPKGGPTGGFFEERKPIEW